MPSSPGYKRNLKQEYATSVARGEQDAGHDGEAAKRMRFRRAALKRGMVKKGQDADHRVPLSKGGSNSLGNERSESAHDNRSFPRNADGSMIVNRPKTKG